MFLSPKILKYLKDSNQLNAGVTKLQIKTQPISKDLKEISELCISTSLLKTKTDENVTIIKKIPTVVVRVSSPWMLWGIYEIAALE